MSEQNGQQQPVQINPLTVELNSCQFGVNFGRDADGNKETHLHFIHMSGVLGFHTVLSENARLELVRQLTGGVLVPQINL